MATSPSDLSELARRYDRPGPRYTSYPTANHFTERFGPDDWEEALRRADRPEGSPLALYVHLPFCARRCAFCGCHAVVSQRRDRMDRYLDAVRAEASWLAARLHRRRQVSQYHWGGGTPTSHSPDELAGLHRALTALFPLTADAEVAIEVDPRVTTVAHLETLARLGFNRLSLGVQDLSEEVQRAIGRHQSRETTAAVIRRARELGIDAINLDLVYGLPDQTRERLDGTLSRVIDWRPSRIAVYGYAHVPHLRPHQRRIDERALPSRDDRIALIDLASRRLTDAGYRRVGMDHFALPDDALARAADAGTLGRNFMGYTPHTGSETLGLGASAISALGGVYAQNHRGLERYEGGVLDGRAATARGCRLTADDGVRAALIESLMCNFRVDVRAFERAHGIRFQEYFAPELATLRAAGHPVADGLVELSAGSIEVTPRGRRFVRNVCMAFDARLRPTPRAHATTV